MYSEGTIKTVLRKTSKEWTKTSLHVDQGINIDFGEPDENSWPRLIVSDDLASQEAQGIYDKWKREITERPRPGDGS